MQSRVQTAFASVVRTASEDVDLNVEGANGLVIVIDVTLDAASASIVFNVDGFDDLSESAYTILDSAAVTAVGTTVLRISPHLTASANVIAKDIIPPRIRISAVAADGDAITYSVTVHSTF